LCCLIQPDLPRRLDQSAIRNSRRQSVGSGFALNELLSGCGGLRSLLAKSDRRFHTPTMSLKNAALLALIGTSLLMLLVLVHFISTVLAIMHGLVPVMALLASMIRLFACFTVWVFFLVFYQKQS
jgi:hypothetical protein